MAQRPSGAWTSETAADRPPRWLREVRVRGLVRAHPASKKEAGRRPLAPSCPGWRHAAVCRAALVPAASRNVSWTRRSRRSLVRTPGWRVRCASHDRFARLSAAGSNSSDALYEPRCATLGVRGYLSDRVGARELVIQPGSLDEEVADKPLAGATARMTAERMALRIAGRGGSWLLGGYGSARRNRSRALGCLHLLPGLSVPARLSRRRECVRSGRPADYRFVVDRAGVAPRGRFQTHARRTRSRKPSIAGQAVGAELHHL